MIQNGELQATTDVDLSDGLTHGSPDMALGK